MTLNSLTLNLPGELLLQIQKVVAGGPEALQRFVLQAIEHELERTQRLGRQQLFFARVAEIRAEMQVEGIEVDPMEIWGDVRDRSPGREVTL